MTILSILGLAVRRQIPGFASTTSGIVGLAIMITPLIVHSGDLEVNPLRRAAYA
jgi:hypothetical protein